MTGGAAAGAGSTLPAEIVEIMLRADRIGIALWRVAAALDVPAAQLPAIEQIVAQRSSA